LLRTIVDEKGPMNPGGYNHPKRKRWKGKGGEKEFRSPWERRRIKE